MHMSDAISELDCEAKIYIIRGLCLYLNIMSMLATSSDSSPGFLKGSGSTIQSKVPTLLGGLGAWFPENILKSRFP